VIRGAPRLVAGALRLLASAPRFVASGPRLSPVLLVTLNAGRNALLGSDTLLKLTPLSLHSTFSQTLLEASSAKNTCC